MWLGYVGLSATICQKCRHFPRNIGTTAAVTSYSFSLGHDPGDIGPGRRSVLLNPCPRISAPDSSRAELSPVQASPRRRGDGTRSWAILPARQPSPSVQLPPGLISSLPCGVSARYDPRPMAAGHWGGARSQCHSSTNSSTFHVIAVRMLAFARWELGRLK